MDKVGFHFISVGVAHGECGCAVAERGGLGQRERVSARSRLKRKPWNLNAARWTFSSPVIDHTSITRPSFTFWEKFGLVDPRGIPTVRYIGR